MFMYIPIRDAPIKHWPNA